MSLDAAISPTVLIACKQQLNEQGGFKDVYLEVPAVRLSNGQLVLAGNAISASNIAAGAVTPAKTLNVEAITATVAGDGTGVISDTTTHATVTSSAGTKIVTLPTPTPGRMLVIDVGANGFKLKTTAPSTIAINGGTGASAVSAIAANSTILAICISATAWKAIFLDADSDVAKVAAAA